MATHALITSRRHPEAAPFLAPPLNPDAELIARCSAHPAQLAAVNAHSGEIDETHPIYEAYADGFHAIAGARAVTLAGILAKARVAKLEAIRSDGSEDWEWTYAGPLAGAVLGDLLRLFGSTGAT